MLVIFPELWILFRTDSLQIKEIYHFNPGFIQYWFDIHNNPVELEIVFNKCLEILLKYL